MKNAIKRVLSVILVVIMLLSLGACTPKDSRSYGFNTGKKLGWNLILVNEWNSVPFAYNKKLITLSNGEKIDKRIYPQLQQMFDDAREQEVYPTVVSGYRTAKDQWQIYNSRIKAYENQGYSSAEAKAEAEKWAAKSGHSEHQTGLAVDINGAYGDNKSVYEWLNENAVNYGFILRYTDEKTEITGIADEPWHYRYVGVDAAKYITENNLCLEEYIAELCSAEGQYIPVG